MDQPVVAMVRVNTVGLIRFQALGLVPSIVLFFVALSTHQPVLWLVSVGLYAAIGGIGVLLLRGSAGPARLGRAGGFLAVSEDAVHVVSAISTSGRPLAQVVSWPRSQVSITEGPWDQWPTVWIDVAGHERFRLEIIGKARTRSQLLAEFNRVTPSAVAAPGPDVRPEAVASGERGRFLTDSQRRELATISPPASSPDWYRDPYDAEAMRFWNGSLWTGRSRPAAE